jgi:hypothetical protein
MWSFPPLGLLPLLVVVVAFIFCVVFCVAMAVVATSASSTSAFRACCTSKLRCEPLIVVTASASSSSDSTSLWGGIVAAVVWLGIIMSGS